MHCARPARRATELVLDLSPALALAVVFAAGAWLGGGGRLSTGLSRWFGSAGECDDPRPEWLMCEDFEGGAAGWRAWFDASQWTECNGCRTGNAENPHRILLDDNPERARSGSFSLHMPGAAEAGYQGASLTYRTCTGEQRAGCTLEGHDQLHLRTHAFLAEDHSYVHHFLAIAGTKPDRYWDADGNAGCRPTGLRYADTTLDFDAARELFFYTYFPDMRCDRGGYCRGDRAREICAGCAAKGMPCGDEPECCWGNHFRPAAPVELERGRWVCLELMMRLNTPGEADGVMAFWVDGALALEQTGMLWRNTPEIQMNKAWLMHYIAPGDTGRSNKIWFDDVVVSTEYIGCGGSETIPSPAPSPLPTDLPPASPEPSPVPSEAAPAPVLRLLPFANR